MFDKEKTKCLAGALSGLSPLEAQDLANRLMLRDMFASDRSLMQVHGTYDEIGELCVVAAWGEDAVWLRGAMQHLTRRRKAGHEESVHVESKPSLRQRITHFFSR